MTRFAFFLSILTIIGLLFDLYFYNGTKSVFNSGKYSNYFRNGYWSISIAYYCYAIITIITTFSGVEASRFPKMLGQTLFFLLFLPKVLASSFLILDDLIRLIRWLFQFIYKTSQTESVSKGIGISRLRFLQVTALGSFGVLLSSLTYGVIKGGYNYTVRKQKIRIPNLPKEFVGMKIGQISDLHVGSFLSLEPMKEAVKLINDQDIEMLFFTGDLVNDRAEEAIDFIDVFKGIKHKVYSVMGNHDYPEYFYDRQDLKSRQHNFDLMKEVQNKMDFELLLNENRVIERNGKKLAILGIENWGGSFSKYGDLAKAYKGVEDADVKLLLSHDPSHWDLQVRKEYPDIDVMFAGHTHGMQFGIEAFGIKFSPVQWKYKQWAGLYKEGSQKIYVNRGLGFVGYPGRVGISPEITVFELTA
ncbi:MAG: metallophosphoesterase [Flavobacteriales bacterium]|nr:metallophosphoesterase [Flavobacteriales bacterium]